MAPKDWLQVPRAHGARNAMIPQRGRRMLRIEGMRVQLPQGRCALGSDSTTHGVRRHAPRGARGVHHDHARSYHVFDASGLGGYLVRRRICIRGVRARHLGGAGVTALAAAGGSRDHPVEPPVRPHGVDRAVRVLWATGLYGELALRLRDGAFVPRERSVVRRRLRDAFV